MSLDIKIKQALTKAISRAGNMVGLAKRSNVDNAAINRYVSGKSDMANMTVHTLERLFPDMQIYFFRDEWPKAQSPPGKPLSGEIPGASIGANKIAAIYDSMTEEGQLELMAQAGALRERHPKNKEVA